MHANKGKRSLRAKKFASGKVSTQKKIFTVHTPGELGWGGDPEKVFTVYTAEKCFESKAIFKKKRNYLGSYILVAFFATAPKV
jgi:D-tyrosyl-tRNA(Tyr) deacylase